MDRKTPTMFRRRQGQRNRTFVFLFSLFAAVVRTSFADDWAYYQHDAAHTGDSTATVDPTALSLAWSAPTGYSTPLVVGNTVYATENAGGTSSPTTISSFALANGAINWNYSGHFVFPSQAAVGGGFVVFQGESSTTNASALYVLDASTGLLRYTVPVAEGPTTVMPTVVQNPTTGAVIAYVADGSNLSAVSLGSTSGSVLWTQTGEFGGDSMPTVVGNSVVVAGPGQYYAFDQTTGSENHFQSGGIAGGGGTTVAYDATRNQFYVLEDFNGSTPTLSAYRYTDNNHITLLWQRTGAGVGFSGASVAIGPNGDVYSAGSSVIWELDPTTGMIVRSIQGSFANRITPVLSNGVLWAYSDNQILAYDLSTLQLLRAFNGSRGSLNSPYDGPGALTDGHFLLDYGDIVGSPGFDVYAAVPEPSIVFLVALGVLVMTFLGYRSRYILRD
jgi:PQQ-like domain